MFYVITTMSIDAFKNLVHFFGQWRERAGLSLRALSESCGVDHATISGLEKGRIKPPKKVVEKIADALALSPEERADLDRWAADIDGVQRIEANTSGIQGKFILRAVAIFAEVDVCDIARVWIQAPAAEAFDVFAAFRDGSAIGLKLANATILKGAELPDGHLPKLAQATRYEVKISEP